MTLPPPDTQIVEFVRALAKADARRDRLREASLPADEVPASPPKRARRVSQEAEQEYTIRWTISEPTTPTGPK